jgi:hypothetical protein
VKLPAFGFPGGKTTPPSCETPLSPDEMLEEPYREAVSIWAQSQI